MRTILWAAALFAVVVLAGGTPDGKRVKDPSEARLKDLQLRYFTDCGGNFKLNAGQCKEITSPRFPKNYRRNSRCPWKFQANNSSTPIIISCNVFNLQKSKNCKKDNVILADGGKNKIIACGEKRSLFWRSDTGSLDVFFKSNFFWQKQGFNCTICAVDPLPNPIRKCVCGKRNINNDFARIIGGAPTRINEYPWHVGLYRRYRFRPYCGGSIISSRWILTAAHCNVWLGDTVMVGAHDWCKGQPPPLLMRIQRIVVHRNYNRKTLENDIALLEVARNIPFQKDNSIAPVCLPKMPINDCVQIEAIATGWGLRNIFDRQPCLLHAVQIKTLTLLDCITQWPGKIFGSMFCAGGVRQGTCFRDSGGPLIETKGTVIGPYEQIGVTSWGSKTCSRPQVYTRVQKFIEWITKICGNSFTCPPYSPWTTIKLNETLQLSS
ncbi:chymotrypsin-like protease CTRL-1 [Penaeus vannamei]|uniref:chymotrypsin-like protease CTRL-1 n=1 Tax=Penaeus vannamei TaxID=6689 RepID=UPI00387F8F2A